MGFTRNAWRILLGLAGATLLVFAILIVWTALRFGADTILGVTTQVKNSTTDLGPFLMETILIGVASMALIQSIRAIYPVRGLFQEWCVARWLSWHSDLGRDSRELVNKLLSVAVAAHGRSVFDLPAEQLLAQIGAAADLVVSFPRDHERLLHALVGEAGAGDASSYFGLSGSPMKTNLSGTSGESEYVDLRNRVAQHIQRRIDGLQISMGRRWRIILRLAAVGLGALFAFVASGAPPVHVADNSSHQQPSQEEMGRDRDTESSNWQGRMPDSEVHGFAKSKPSESKSNSEIVLEAPWRSPRHPEEDERESAPALQRGLFVAITGLVSGFMASLFRDLVAIIEKFRR
jgi:hypothetical protein